MMSVRYYTCLFHYSGKRSEQCREAHRAICMEWSIACEIELGIWHPTTHFYPYICIIVKACEPLDLCIYLLPASLPPSSKHKWQREAQIEHSTFLRPWRRFSKIGSILYQMVRNPFKRHFTESASVLAGMTSPLIGEHSEQWRWNATTLMDPLNQKPRWRWSNWQEVR